MPADLWVIGTKRIKKNLLTAARSSPISIDPTFNFGAYEVTPLTHRHPLIEAKLKNETGKWADAIMIGPAIIHHGKSEETYDNGIRGIARKAKLVEENFGFITDGEVALINACKKNFIKAVDLRCTLHFKRNCADF